ncbi:CDK5 regulatory subunit-associated protein 2 [Xenentodon cancila]
MDSVVGDDQTLPVDINGSCRLPDSINAGDYSTDSMTAPSFSDKMSPIKALTMKDYENQITALKKENFNLKLRIYFMEERMQQKCDDSTEDIFKTNIELKVELESMKRELAEKQELLVSASKALESLAGRESGEPQRVREQAQREMDALRDSFSKRIADLEQSLQTAEEEVEKMAAIAEQEKRRNINMEKQLQVLAPQSAFVPGSTPSPVQDLQQALQEKDNIIEQLKITLSNQEALIHQKSSKDQQTDAQSAKQLSDLIAEKDQELKALRDQLNREKEKTQPDQQWKIHGAMRDPCRICGAGLVGSQCRWIFSSSGKRKLQVILSHVLGREVFRDGRGEFLCGKCVFQLEKVVQFDVNISQLQDEHSSQIQKLQAEKEHLIQCIVHIYNKNNPGRCDRERATSKTPIRSSRLGSPDNEAACQLAHEGLSFRDNGLGQNRMRRCVSLDRIVSKGAFPGRSGLRSSRLGSGAGLGGSMKSIGNIRHRSQSVYLDLVQRKNTLSRHGFKGRSTSLMSLNREISTDIPQDSAPKRKLREPKVFGARHGTIDDPAGRIQAKALLHSSSSQPSVISDLIQILRCISKQQMSAPAGSRIPVLKRLNSGTVITRAKQRHRNADWKSLHDLTEEFYDDYTPVRVKKSDINQLESVNKRLSEELNQVKHTIENLRKTLEDSQNQNKIFSEKLDEKENDLNSEKKNALKRDKTIQGLTQVLGEKEKEIAELCHEIEDRDDALAKAREAAHKAQLQKYQALEEHQNLLMEKQNELAQLQGEHHCKVLEAQKLQRALDRKEQELADLQQTKDQLEVELEDLQQQKKKGDKALNDLHNQLKKLSGEIGERESALEQQYQDMLEQTKRKLHTHEVTIQRLTSTLADKDQQLQEYMNMVKDFEQSRSPGSNDGVLTKLRQRLKEKESALEQVLDEKFAAIEEKDNEIHQLQLSLREKERDLDRLNNLLAHNEETINNFDTLIKEKDVELQHLTNTLKNLQRAKQDVEDNLNRSLREKDSIINQLQLSLEGKTKDMEEMAESMLNQSQTHSRDLAEQMGQRLKVTEAMLAEAVKARERLVADNESAVEGLLATIGSKDLLLKESAEHFNRMLSERTQEIQELRKQLSEKQQEIANAEKQSSSTAQENYLETAELRALLAEKDSLINKLLQRGQERDQFLAQMSHKVESDHVLELRQTIQIMQEKLDNRDAELSKKNSEDIQESNPLSKKTVVVLKKELAQKTEALNKALKRENELKISLADLQSLLSELEGRSEGQAANIESLTATLKTKEEIINVLHQRLGQGGDSRVDHTQDHVIGSGMERSLPVLPQREKTMIGGDRQQDSLPNLMALQKEHDALNKALRAEQQLYSNLARAVKEQDSAQRLHALQLELTAVQLLRQQLEDGIKTNEELRDDLERETLRAKLREGVNLSNQSEELESMRHQLEDAQRWNASLQARLGAIQNRGGGVGGAKDGGDSLSFIGDQTSYLSICVGEGLDDSLSHLSAQELRQKILELQEQVSGLQHLNDGLQSRLSLMDESQRGAQEVEDKTLTTRRPSKQQSQKTCEMQLPYHSTETCHPDQDKESQTSIEPGQMASGKLFSEENVDDCRGLSKEHALSDGSLSETEEKTSRKMSRDVMMLKSLLSDCGFTSVLQLREELLQLISENAELRGLLKEQISAECKEKESTDVSGNSSDGQAELRRSFETLHTEAKDYSEVVRLLKKRREKKLSEVSDGETPVTTVVAADEMKSPQLHSQSQTKSPKQHFARQRASVKSRLPVPVRLKVEANNGNQPVNPNHLQTDASQHLNLDEVYGSDQLTDSNSPTTPQDSTSPSCTLTFIPHSCSPSGFDKGSEGRKAVDPTQTNSDLLTQLELLHQECQEKEVLINKLGEQLADWEELHIQLQEKERLIHQYTEALQAAQSTIAYLTACTMDSQGGFGVHTDSGFVGSDAALHSKCIELQKALQEKEELTNQFIKLLNMVEEVISSSCNQEKNPGIGDLSLKIKGALQELNASSKREGPKGFFGDSGESLHELQRQADSLQAALFEQNRLNAELQEQLWVANTSAQRGGLNDTTSLTSESLREETKESHSPVGGSDNSLNQKMFKVLQNCFSATESVVYSLAAHCANSASLGSVKSSHINLDLERNLEKLERALQEKKQLDEPAQPTKSSGNLPTTATKIEGQKLHQDLRHLYKVFNDCFQRITDLQASLQEVRGHRGESEAHKTVQDAKGLPPSVQVQLETLHKALREKKKACKNLEDKLATALTKTSSTEAARKAPEHGDKAVQVDLQDLGYETSGKSENDREESSSTDLEVGVNPSCSASSLPSLLKHEQAAFSSTENLDSTSSTPYPSSPAQSSAKVSLKSLQVYDEYGASDDPIQLQAQVRELKIHLENQTKLIVQMKSLLRRNSLSSDLVASTFDLSVIGEQEGAHKFDHNQERNYKSGQAGEKKEAENHPLKNRTSRLNLDLESERTPDRSISEQLQQTRSRSTSPARLDSLVQSQARELSQLRQQIKESRRLGSMQRWQLEELNKAFKELLHAGEVDYYMGGVVKEQLDKSLSILDRLEGRLDKGEPHLDKEDVAALELSRSLGELQQASKSPLSHEESMEDPPDSLSRIQWEIDYLRLELEAERVLLQQHVSLLVHYNLTLAECTREQLDLLAKELQEKNRLIQSLQSQIRGQSPSSHHSSQSDLYHSDRTCSSHHSSPAAQGTSRQQQHHPDWAGAAVPPGGGAEEDGVPGHREAASRLQGLQRENGRLQEQLRSSEELNTTLRSELDLHQSIMAQTSSHHQEQDKGQVSGPQTEAHGQDGDVGSQKNAVEVPHTMSSDLLGEHLQEIRALRQRLEESIHTNDRLREQLEKRLAEVEKDPAATNIFIHGNEDQGQLANEVRFLWGQNQALQDQLNMGSRDKQKENEKLRETVARRTSKLEQSRRECEALRQENSRLKERLEQSNQENSALQDSLHSSKEEQQRLQCAVKLQKQQLADSQRLLQSLRVEIKVYEKMKNDLTKHNESDDPTQPPITDPSSGSVDLRELLSEIRHLRVQLERSIQTNMALRQKLEEQLLRGPNRSETININYMLSSPDERGLSPGREGSDPQHHSFHTHKENTSVLYDVKHYGHSEVDGSVSSGSDDSVSGAPFRLVPGHRMWASRNGRHVLGLIEDYNALRKQISEGRKLSRSMDAQLQECLHTLKQHGSGEVMEQQHLKSLSSSTNTMQQVLDEAGRLLKLLWRVSLPAGFAAGENGNNQQDELLKNEIARLRSRLSQQERMLSGAVKRLRTTNQLKEGMERVIIDQLSLTHGVLKKARGNLETNYCTLFGLKGLSGGPDEGGSSQWPVADAEDAQQTNVPSSIQTAEEHSEISEDYKSDASLHCSY